MTKIKLQRSFVSSNSSTNCTTTDFNDGLCVGKILTAPYLISECRMKTFATTSPCRGS